MTGTAGTLDPGMGMGWEGGGGLMAPEGGASGLAGMPEALEVGNKESWLPRGIESKLWKDLGSSWGRPPSGTPAVKASWSGSDMSDQHARSGCIQRKVMLVSDALAACRALLLPCCPDRLTAMDHDHLELLFWLTMPPCCDLAFCS